MIYYYSNNPNGYVTGKCFSVEEPCVTIMAAGMGGDSASHWHLADDGRAMNTDRRPRMEKPPYRVPLMAEIAAIPWNGLKVASTFSGAGGSCLGYRMAGFKVVWANEFVPMAQESYKANAAPDCVLDGRNIKHIQPHDILAATGLKVGELDLFDGSPPCQAFSTAGKREKGWGKDKKYEHGATQKNETLFDEYIRLLRGLQPKVFVAENVSGLVKGTAKGMFLQILAAMKASGYRVTCRVLDAQWLGVPQQRQRTIFIGVRNDLNKEPVHPLPLLYRYSVRDALPWIDEAVHDTGGNKPDRWAANVPIANRPALTIINGVNGVNASHFKVTKAKHKKSMGVKVFHAAGGFSLTETTDRPMPAITATQCRVTVQWPNKGFRGGTKSSMDEPLPSVQASAGTTGGTIISNGIERRKFTIEEVKRICAFPDDFVLKGSYAQQWERLGNSVPPLMMRAIAETIRDEILCKQ